jgi:hypothetical protein
MSDSEKMASAVHQADRVEPGTPTKSPLTIDTVHQDEAMKVLATYQGDEHWDEMEEKKLRRKVDWKLMPILCVTYMLQYYDKAMLSQAVRPKSSLLFKV